MASRLISFLRLRLGAVLVSVAAVVSCFGLYRQWERHEETQRSVLAAYPRLLEQFTHAEVEQMMPEPSGLVLAALTAGIMIAAALALWIARRPE